MGSLGEPSGALVPGVGCTSSLARSRTHLVESPRTVCVCSGPARCRSQRERSSWAMRRLCLAPPLVAGAAHLGPISAADQPSFGAVVFLITGLIIAATAEELMMRGYAFQVLLASIGRPHG